MPVSYQKGINSALLPLLFFPSQLCSGHPEKFHRYLHIWNNMIFLVIMSWRPLWSKGRKGVRNYNLKTSRLAEWCCPQLKSNLKGKTLLLLRSAQPHQLSQRKSFSRGVHRTLTKQNIAKPHWPACTGIQSDLLPFLPSDVKSCVPTIGFLCARLTSYKNFHFWPQKKRKINIIFKKTFHNGYFFFLSCL